MLTYADMVGVPLKSIGLPDIAGRLTPLTPGLYFKVSIRQHTSAYVSIRDKAYVSIRQTLVSILQRT